MWLPKVIKDSFTVSLGIVACGVMEILGLPGYRIISSFINREIS
jgi:hypothetical protein